MNARCRSAATFAIVVLIGTNSFADHIVLHYNFDGNALDLSGNGNDGTIFGNPAFVAGQSDQAIFFNNAVGQQVATQFVSLPNSASVLALQDASFTFAINYKSTDTSFNNGRLFGRDPGPGNSLLVFDVNSGAPPTYAQVRDTSNHLVGTFQSVAGNPVAQTSDGEWHWGFVVLDRGAGELRQYVDSTLVATEGLNAFSTVILSDLNIGRLSFNTTFGSRLTAVDEFLLYDRALTTADVRDVVLGRVPEPGSLILLGTGIATLLVAGRYRRGNNRKSRRA